MNQTGIRPVVPLLSHRILLRNTLGSDMAYVGFTSGTGGSFANHDIVSWTFHSKTGYYVAPPPTGSDTNNGQTRNSPFATIQHAIDVARGSAGEPVTLFVAAGIYVENIVMDDWESLKGGWNIDFSERWDFESGVREPSDEYKTVIDGGGNGTSLTAIQDSY